MSLYTDLEKARTPLTISARYIKGHLPVYYAYTQEKNNRKRNSSLDHILIHPISFGIADEDIFRVLSSKTKAFGRVIPGVKSTYYKLENESNYFEDMRKSLFVITYKKSGKPTSISTLSSIALLIEIVTAGWDCLRHYESLATGSLPLFININECPPLAMAAHPKKLYSQLLKFPGLQYSAHQNKKHPDRHVRQTFVFDKLTLNWGQFDHRLYNVGSNKWTPAPLTICSGCIFTLKHPVYLLQAIALAMGYYTRNVLSTTAMAKFLIQRCFENSLGYLKSPTPKSVLYLTHENRAMDKGDYMVELILHGLKRVLGETNVVDFPPRNCIYKTFELFNESSYRKSRKKLYGMGFSFGYKIDLLDNRARVNREDIQKNLKLRAYDLVILGSGKWGFRASCLYKVLPAQRLFGTVCV